MAGYEILGVETFLTVLVKKIYHNLGAYSYVKISKNFEG